MDIAMLQSKLPILRDFVSCALFSGRRGLIGYQETAFGSIAKKNLLID
jgi:hypothetical protein